MFDISFLPMTGFETMDLWCQMRLLYQLSHTHCPINENLLNCNERCIEQNHLNLSNYEKSKQSNSLKL